MKKKKKKKNANKSNAKKKNVTKNKKNNSAKKNKKVSSQQKNNNNNKKNPNKKTAAKKKPSSSSKKKPSSSPKKKVQKNKSSSSSSNKKKTVQKKKTTTAKKSPQRRNPSAQSNFKRASKSTPRTSKPRKSCLQQCTKTAPCQSGLRCVHNKCRKLRAVSENCSGKCDLCDKGSSCKSGKCIRQREGLCGNCSQTKDCMSGLTCAVRPGTKTKVCSTVVKTHEQCNKGCVTCKARVACHVDGFCGGARQYTQCDRCHRGLTKCGVDMVCHPYTPVVSRCTKLAQRGESCDDSCSMCQRDLECHNGMCEAKARKLCESCEQDGDCQFGLLCKKSSAGFGRCALPKDRGGPCNDQCSVCKEGLVCRDGVTCDLPRNALCGKCAKDSDCGIGLYCKISSRTGSGSCAAPQIRGGSCSEPCKTCQPGSTCSWAGRCEAVRRTLCTNCRTDNDCAKGLVCKDDKVHRTKKCARPFNAGQRCDQACWGCRAGLSCVTGISGRTCAKKQEGMCGPCTVDADCQAGLTCKRGSNGQQKCAKLVSKGARCSDPCWACDNGLVCSGGHTCMPKTVGLCEVCENDANCENELRCKKGPDGTRRCARPMLKGGKCGHRCWTCASGFTCNSSNVCQ